MADAGTRFGSLDVTYSARGYPTYRMEMWHDGLNKHRLIRGDDDVLVQQKARIQANEWELRWADVSERNALRASKAQGRIQQEEKKAEAAERTNSAADALKELSCLLAATFAVDDRVDWSSLMDRTPFREAIPVEPAPPRMPVRPVRPKEPSFEDARYLPTLSFFDKLLPGRRKRATEKMQALFFADHQKWKLDVDEFNQRITQVEATCARLLAQVKEAHEKAIAAWQDRKDAFLREQAASHETLQRRKRAYEAKEPAAISDYCDLVLSASSYPDSLPQEFDVHYDESSSTLVVDYRLPSPEDLPTLKAVRYVAARGSMEETHISEAQRMKLYDDVVYQIALRTLHELFEADVVDGLAAAVFNGIVQAIDRTSGNEVTACIMSVRASKAEFTNINLAQVDPKACFKALKGVGSSKLSGLVPIAPVMQMSREDARFVASYEVAKTLDEGVNLAAMDWEDFEHLIRELFEKEFSMAGGEVRVTQASRDGGVDAVVFDPDPIRGGKIVIQAKRWTNTVGVAAVRDLYGTVTAEGANKGILVTTSDYGPDSYAFANGKPLVLLSGANLLHMLAKHGHQARINIAEARRQGLGM